MQEWTPQAVADLDQITAYLESYEDELADAVEAAIFDQVDWLETHSMAGSKIEGLGREYKLGYAIRQNYKIFYKVLGADHIKVLMIRSSKQLPPGPREIKAADR